ncbi:ATP-binding protein [Zoogloea sp.]|uniref:hybrid sensor histidine kinase/response regulator n=1 Tax=Zoogloea sp. TaxID=49181 RepID=UPI0035B0102E
MPRGLSLDKDESASVLSPEARLPLLEMAFRRLIFGIRAMPFVGVPFILWMVHLGLDIDAMLLWLAAYGLGNLWVIPNKSRLERDVATLPAEAVLTRWRPVAHRAALVHGLGVSTVSLITAGRVPIEFAFLLVSTQMSIVAGNATHQSPEFGTFKRFFLTAWGGCVVLAPWSFPSMWVPTGFLMLFYVVAIHRHAKSSHHFFVRYAELEESSKRLAESYRVAKEEAEAALQAKSQFLTTASHDLRQPVHAMGFLIESIIHRNRDAAQLSALEDLRRSVSSVTLMFNSLLDLSRIENGGVHISRVQVDIDTLLRDVEILYREEARSRGLALRIHSSSRRRVALADPVLLRQSLVNLVHNALRYTSRGGVLLGARRRGPDWRLEVWDTGVGVANTDRGRIYSPFFRNEHAWRIDSAGHGLGLAVVARCAELMGAAHGFDSVEGRGSRFWIQFPAVSAEASPPRIEAGRPPQVYRQLSGTCLVIDDDPQVSSAWQSLMQAWGIDVRCAASAMEAFAHLDRGFQPRAILCDQRLRSGESGVDVLKALFVRCPDASGAMVSGEHASPELQEAEQDGYLVLRKPVAVPQLYSLMEQWLN